ncbi:unnamed protein product [Lota lota]
MFLVLRVSHQIMGFNPLLQPYRLGSHQETPYYTAGENDACRSEVVIMGWWLFTVGTTETLMQCSGDSVSRTYEVAISPGAPLCWAVMLRKHLTYSTCRCCGLGGAAAPLCRDCNHSSRIVRDNAGKATELTRTYGNVSSWGLGNGKVVSQMVGKPL